MIFRIETQSVSNPTTTAKRHRDVRCVGELVHREASAVEPFLGLDEHAATTTRHSQPRKMVIQPAGPHRNFRRTGDAWRLVQRTCRSGALVFQRHESRRNGNCVHNSSDRGRAVTSRWNFATRRFSCSLRRAWNWNEISALAFPENDMSKDLPLHSEPHWCCRGDVIGSPPHGIYEMD